MLSIKTRQIENRKRIRTKNFDVQNICKHDLHFCYHGCNFGAKCKLEKKKLKMMHFRCCSGHRVCVETTCDYGCTMGLILYVTDRFLTFSKDFLKMRSQTEVKEKKRKNVSRDNIVSKLKYDFTKNLAQLQRTLLFTLILMAKIRQKVVHSMWFHDLFSNYNI